MAPEVPASEDPADRSRRLEAENSRLRALLHRLFASQEAERRSVARNLHDRAGQSLTAVRMAAAAALQEDDPARLREDLDDIIGQADAALAEVRRLCALLRPPQLDALGLEAALRGHAERLAAAGQAPSLELQLAALPARPPAELEQACFRIAEDALDNVLRHAGAQNARLALAVADGALVLEVRDDGRGFAPGATTPGAGLLAMGERARACGGRLAVDSTPGRGTRVLAQFPFSAAAPANGGRP